MNRFILPLFLVALLGIAGGSAWYLVHSRQAAIGQPAPVATSTQDSFSGDAIYTNGTYGFAVRYPEMAKVDYTFEPTYHLGQYWRATAQADSVGTPLVSFATFETKSENSYPRYYYAMVRIGVSTDKKELDLCTKLGKNAGETQLPDETIGGATWKVFSFESAGMMQYAKGVSYRTVYEGTCFAMEKIATGSSYRDDPASSKDIPDTELTKHYNELDSIVHSFMFARPN
jgi:hypothetical protein